MSSLLSKLIRRGLISGTYPASSEYHDKLNNLLQYPPATVYAGFDATGPSLHVGNLATIINLLHFQRHGHQVICLIGDATTQIGDPSGHTRDRKKINNDVITHNANCIEQTLRQLFKNFAEFFSVKRSGEGAASSVTKLPIFVRNSDWYKEMNVIGFVGEIFREVRVGGLLHKKSIQERLQSRQGINMAEFCYQIFQAFDWIELHKRYDCRIQIGGADQGGNIYTGHDLIKKHLGRDDSIGLLAPLITSSKSGKKLGKSVSNDTQTGIWLRGEQTTPFDLYQFFHRTPDNDVEKFLRVFSFYEDDFIEDLIQNRLKKHEDIWYCQRKLAEQACLLVHGEDGLNTARRITEESFSR